MFICNLAQKFRNHLSLAIVKQESQQWLKAEMRLFLLYWMRWHRKSTSKYKTVFIELVLVMSYIYRNRTIELQFGKIQLELES